jgi:tRNA(fMet)-specific endonuclease VapC
LNSTKPLTGRMAAESPSSPKPPRLDMERLRRSLNSLHIWPYEFTAAQEFGRLATILKRTGRTMQQIDVQIATIALTLGDCAVISKDRDLFAVPGLDVENWATS